MRKYKQHILYIAIINILSLICANNISALSYSTDVGVSFTFNPTISISLSSSNLDISNLVPGNTLDSNIINVSVSSNNANGYTMFATAGNAEHNNTNLNHSNNTDTFSSIPTNANLANLTADNTWGYSYSIDNGSSWFNYNGLSLYSDTGTTLINKLGPSESNIDFKIAAKASSTQASGTYSNVINFIAITRPNPVSLEEAYSSYYLSTGKTKHNGYYVMQDMNSTICNNVELLDSELQVIDIRDDKVYWIAKLRDGHCWMTQNLDLDIDETKIYTHWNTDLGWTANDENANWQPMEGHSTIAFSGETVDGWTGSKTEPYSANPGEIYYYPSSYSAYLDEKYNSLQNCQAYGRTDCEHRHAGNYYNWPATVAGNNVSQTGSGNAPNSICPASWKLPSTSSNEFGELLFKQGIITSATGSGKIFSEDGVNNLRIKPLFFLLTGYIIDSGKLTYPGRTAYYWSSTSYDESFAGNLYFIEDNIYPRYRYNLSKSAGFPVRCLAR